LTRFAVPSAGLDSRAGFRLHFQAFPAPFARIFDRHAFEKRVAWIIDPRRRDAVSLPMSNLRVDRMSTLADAVAPPSPSRRCLDADQVAERYGMSRRQVFRAADALLIPFGFRVGRLRRWDEFSISEHIAAGCPPLRRRGR
jgi:predicted DNA-binding transcriptional regulator AlpA